MKKIINIINFIRQVEPREEGKYIDLKEPIIEQIRIMRENGLTGTFLLQYDTMISPDFMEIIHTCEDFCEIGVWLEIVQPLVEAIGETWKGRYPWDWHNDVGFLIGYEPDVRLRLIDEAMEKYKSIYGKYPDSVGSWHIDAVSMKYLYEKYKIKACCICREQVGTDGYTLQGGYYNQAYYPSVNNMFCPASTKENQINMPVFRMLGSDPVLMYDFNLFKYPLRHGPTLESAQLGDEAPWVDWYFKEVFGGNGLCFQYAQAGQENSFGWKRMSPGITYQFPKIADMAKRGELEVMTLRESGKWYRSTYEMTPSSTVTAMSSYLDPDVKSVWYSSRYYRANLIWDHGVVRFRDTYKFDEKYQEHYLHRRCDISACEFRNLPIMDGVLYTNLERGVIAGIYLKKDGDPICWTDFQYCEENFNAKVRLTSEYGEAILTFSEMQVELKSNIDGLTLSPVYDVDNVYGRSGKESEIFGNKNNKSMSITYVSKVKKDGQSVSFVFDGFEYAIKVLNGYIDSSFCVHPENGVATVSMV